MKRKYICSECKGDDVQIIAWIDSNTLEYVDNIDEPDTWCCDCEDNTKQIAIYVDDDGNCESCHTQCWLENPCNGQKENIL